MPVLNISGVMNEFKVITFTTDLQGSMERENKIVTGIIVVPSTTVSRSKQRFLFEASVLNNVFCSDTNTLPLYLPRFTSIADFETVLTSRGDVCTQRSLKCTPASEVLC